MLEFSCSCMSLNMHTCELVSVCLLCVVRACVRVFVCVCVLCTVCVCVYERECALMHANVCVCAYISVFVFFVFLHMNSEHECLFTCIYLLQRICVQVSERACVRARLL